MRVRVMSGVLVALGAAARRALSGGGRTRPRSGQARRWHGRRRSAPGERRAAPIAGWRCMLKPHTRYVWEHMNRYTRMSGTLAITLAIACVGSAARRTEVGRERSDAAVRPGI